MEDAMQGRQVAVKQPEYKAWFTVNPELVPSNKDQAKEHVKAIANEAARLMLKQMEIDGVVSAPAR